MSLFLPHFRPAEGWGQRSQLGYGLAALEDLEHNRDGLILNEALPQGHLDLGLKQNPGALRAMLWASVGLDTRDGVGKLQRFREDAERHWGAPVIDPAIVSQLHDGKIYAALRAIDLVGLGKKPSEITDGFFTASGSVDGAKIEPRNIHFIHWKPVAEPQGKVVVVSPGFLESGESFALLADHLSKLGYDVVIGEHQWAGHSSGKAGGIDRGFGVTRDAAAMGALGAKLTKQLYGDRGQVLILGNSMGAGPGVLTALTMNDNDRLKLEGDQLPKGLPFVCIGAYFGASDNAQNAFTGLLAKSSLINKKALPAIGMPSLTDAALASQRGAQTAVRVDARAQAKASDAVVLDTDKTLRLIDGGLKPHGIGALIHSANDSLADPGKLARVAARLGIEPIWIPGSNHVHHQDGAMVIKIGRTIDEVFARAAKAQP
jgi:pimeloyl-ACP methyl ester carboxylesterase